MGVLAGGAFTCFDKKSRLCFCNEFVEGNLRKLGLLLLGLICCMSEQSAGKNHLPHT